MDEKQCFAAVFELFPVFRILTLQVIFKVKAFAKLSTKFCSQLNKLQLS